MSPTQLQISFDRFLLRHLGKGPRGRKVLRVLHRLELSLYAFITHGLDDQVASLSFSTLFALVPLMAVLLALARGFGFDSYIESQFRNFMASQPQVADFIIKFADNYLANNQSYFIVGIGFLFMIYTVVSLFRSVERTFNSIWQVEKTRDVLRTVIDYMWITLLFTVALVISAGLTIYLGGLFSKIISSRYLVPAAKVVGPCLQVVALWVAFLFLYTFIPNDLVPVKAALGPSLLSAVLLVLFQWLYAFVQFFLSSYNTIYGSVAILPLFMISLMVAWSICLYGAQLTYLNQYGGSSMAFSTHTKDLKHRDYLRGMLLVLAVTHHNNIKDCYPDISVISRQTGIPVRLAQEMMHQLQQLRLAHLAANEEDDGVKRYAVALTVAERTLRDIVNTIDTQLGTSIRWNREFDSNLRRQINRWLGEETEASSEKGLLTLGDLSQQLT